MYYQVYRRKSRSVVGLASATRSRIDRCASTGLAEGGQRALGCSPDIGAGAAGVIIAVIAAQWGAARAV